MLCKRAAGLLLLVCLGCSAQSTSPAEVSKRVEHLLRTHYTIAAEVSIKVGTAHPSPDFPGYDVIPVTLSRGDRSTTKDFLLSKDQKRLVDVTTITDPMEKIDLHGRPSRGAANAKVLIVTYDDFQCPFCARNHATLFTELLKEYGDRIRIIYKDYPLASLHPWAEHAAIDSDCLNEQSSDAYWAFADFVHANQRDITGTNRPLPEQFALLDKDAADAAQKHGVNNDRLQACLKTQPDAEMRASMTEANSLGVEATPTMFVNGEKFDGAVPIEALRASIDRALKDAGVPAGPAPGTVSSVTTPPPAAQNH